MAQTKVGEAYVEIHPRLAKDFSKKLRDELEKKLAPISRDLGRNVGASLGDSVGEHFAERFGEHADGMFRVLDLSDQGQTLGERTGDAFGDGFRTRASVGLDEYGREMETTVTRHLSNVSRASERTGRDIDFNLGSRLAGAITSTGGLIGNLSRLATTASLAGGALATLAGGAAVAAQGALALAAALAPAAGIVAALPGGIALAAASFGVLKLALSGVGEAFAGAITGDLKTFLEATADVAPAVGEVAYELFQMHSVFLGFKENVQDAFFQPLVGQMWSLLEPLNALHDGMVQAAGAFGRGALMLVEFIRSGESVWAIQAIFRALTESIDGMIPALRSLLNGFRDLSVVGAGWLASLTPGIANAVNQFGHFMRHAAASGQALEWMDNALAVFKQLGQLVADLVGIFRALFQAVEQTGSNALGVLGSLVGGLRDFLESARGQEILVAIFEAIGRIGAALLPVLQALAGAVATLAPTLATLAELIGPILTTAINALAPALSTIGAALVVVFEQLGAAVTVLAESGALDALAQAIAAILIAVAPLLPHLTTLVSLLVEGLAFVITNYVAPALSTLVGWITDAVNWLQGGGLSEDTWISRVISTIYEKALPIWEEIGALIEQVASDIIAWFTDNQDQVAEWGDQIIEIVSDLGDVIAGVWEFIAWAWDNFGGPLLDIIANVFNGILDVVGGVMQALKGVIETIMGVLTGDWDRAWNGIKDILEGVWDALYGVVETILKNMHIQVVAVLEAMGVDWEGSWNKVKETAERIWTAIVEWVSARVDDIVSTIEWFAGLPALFGTWLDTTRAVISAELSKVVDNFNYLKNAVVAVFDGAVNWLSNAGRDIVQGLWNGAVEIWNNFIGWWNSAIDSIQGIARRILDMNSPSRVMHDIGVGVGEGMAQGIRSSSTLIDDAVTAMAETAVDAWGTPEFPAPAFDTGAAVRRLPGDMPLTHSQDLIRRDGLTKVYDITLEAVPTVPTERQIVDALDYADALYAAT